MAQMVITGGLGALYLQGDAEVRHQLCLLGEQIALSLVVMSSMHASGMFDMSDALQRGRMRRSHLTRINMGTRRAAQLAGTLLSLQRVRASSVKLTVLMFHHLHAYH